MLDHVRYAVQAVRPHVADGVSIGDTKEVNRVVVVTQVQHGYRVGYGQHVRHPDDAERVDGEVRE